MGWQGYVLILSGAFLAAIVNIMKKKYLKDYNILSFKLRPERVGRKKRFAASLCAGNKKRRGDRSVQLERDSGRF